MESIKMKLKDFDGIAMDARGQSSGLAMFWKKSLDVSLLSISLHHIDITISLLQGSQEKWQFTGVYGYPENHYKLKTCNLIRDLHDHSTLPWLLVGGDINNIFYNMKKRGGAEKQQTILNAFRDAFESCGLHDLGFQGYEFTCGTVEVATNP
ncbi:LOW QUALITY PROTEIN: hypothetical protein Cgig2_008963 [Carnegiea gigantea]|uniref:Endonuclease/exonuclease/phosphatase domain-containing protein n=1 Tax=Carnegiea gigantea TaxID=171969 RepID=A0A9Q1K6Y3_9CARY|nr:LOW QUALITY PROTEIN: hypothetical protein Cgig2_008963 [Carnegiea gigantea]